MTPNKNILSLYKLLYRDDPVKHQAYKDAFEIYPIYKTDCSKTVTKKTYLIEEYVKLIMSKLVV